MHLLDKPATSWGRMHSALLATFSRIRWHSCPTLVGNADSLLWDTSFNTYITAKNDEGSFPWQQTMEQRTAPQLHVGKSNEWAGHEESVGLVSSMKHTALRDLSPCSIQNGSSIQTWSYVINTTLSLWRYRSLIAITLLGNRALSKFNSVMLRCSCDLHKIVSCPFCYGPYMFQQLPWCTQSVHIITRMHIY